MRSSKDSIWNKMKMNWMTMLIHLAAVVTFGYAFYYDLTFVHIPSHLRSKFSSMTAFPGKWKYLTVWNEVLQVAYFSVALLNDFAGTSEVNAKKQSMLQKFRDYLFASWAFPIGTFVSLSFWILYGIDRALVFPKEMDEFFPLWLNHAVHTAPAVMLLVESYVSPKIFPPLSAGVIANLFLSCSYIAWITWVNYISGVWAYPLLNILNTYQRAVFKAGCAAAILACYYVGVTLNSWRWGKAQEARPAAKAGAKTAAKGKRKVK